MKLKNKTDFLDKALKEDILDNIADIALGDYSALGLAAEDADFDLVEPDGWTMWIEPGEGEYDPEEDWLTPAGEKSLKKIQARLNKEYDARLRKFGAKLQKLIAEI